MRILSFFRVLLLLFLSCFVAIVSPTVILTQNVTNTVEDSITVFPGITIQITCVITGSDFIQWVGDGGTPIINNGSQQAATLGDFSLMLLNINESSISSTATAVSSSNTSLTCSDNDGNIETIDIYIKPVDPQVYMIQNVTIATPLLVYWSGNWTMDKAFL
uniref:Ig-like domain-containing protein n=1 Tax=Amphimedon queenslandica TaxID=400682 RepID=A0A1X7ST48_AMPQE